MRKQKNEGGGGLLILAALAGAGYYFYKKTATPVTTTPSVVAPPVIAPPIVITPAPVTPDLNGAVVQELYQRLLGRAPDTVGFNTYVSELNSGAKTAAMVEQNIRDSAEFRARVAVPTAPEIAASAIRRAKTITAFGFDPLPKMQSYYDQTIGRGAEMPGWMQGEYDVYGRPAGFPLAGSANLIRPEY